MQRGRTVSFALLGALFICPSSPGADDRPTQVIQAANKQAFSGIYQVGKAFRDGWDIAKLRAEANEIEKDDAAQAAELRKKADEREEQAKARLNDAKNSFGASNINKKNAETMKSMPDTLVESSGRLSSSKYFADTNKTMHVVAENGEARSSDGNRAMPIAADHAKKTGAELRLVTDLDGVKKAVEAAARNPNIKEFTLTGHSSPNGTVLGEGGIVTKEQIADALSGLKGSTVEKICLSGCSAGGNGGDYPKLVAEKTGIPTQASTDTTYSWIHGSEITPGSEIVTASPKELTSRYRELSQVVTPEQYASISSPPVSNPASVLSNSASPTTSMADSYDTPSSSGAIYSPATTSGVRNNNSSSGYYSMPSPNLAPSSGGSSNATSSPVPYQSIVQAPSAVSDVPASKTSPTSLAEFAFEEILPHVGKSEEVKYNSSNETPNLIQAVRLANTETNLGFPKSSASMVINSLQVQRVNLPKLIKTQTLNRNRSGSPRRPRSRFHRFER